MQPTAMKTAVTNKSTFSTNLFFGINLHDAIFAVEIKTETPAVGKTKEKIRTIGIAPLKTHAYFVAQTITARHNRPVAGGREYPPDQDRGAVHQREDSFRRGVLRGEERADGLRRKPRDKT